jgi:hypothetical protein
MKAIGAILSILIYAAILTPIWIVWFDIKHLDINNSTAICWFIITCICIYPATKLQTIFLKWYESNLK